MGLRFAVTRVIPCQIFSPCNVPGNAKRRRVIPQRRNVNLSCDSLYFVYAAFNMCNVRFPYLPLFVMILIDVSFECYIHSKNFLFVDFHPTANVESPWWHMQPCRCNDIFSTHEQACALWSTDGFASRYHDKIETHIIESPQI